MKDDLELLLRRTNPWLWNPGGWEDAWSSRMPSAFVPRIPVGWRGSFPINKATLVVGPRQSGKSTFLWSELHDLGPEVLMVNCEEPLFRQWCRSPALFLGELRQLLPKPGAILFEEVQHLEEAGLFLKGLVDLKPGYPILATGSSAFHLMAATRESLAGRALRLQLLPFSLKETTYDIQHLPIGIRLSRQKKLLERMLRYGSYPEVWLSDEPESILVGLLEGIIIKDASDLFRIDHPMAFRKLLKLMAGQLGNLVNLAEWASICGVSSKTVRRYVSMLEQSHVVTLLPPWVSGKRAELTGTPKVYFLDNGIRNVVIPRLQTLHQRDDLGPLWENWVFGEIKKTIHPVLDGLGFWRTRSGAEVDFVVERQGHLLAVEVKAGAVGRPRITRSGQSFIKAAHPELFITVHSGPYMEDEFAGCRLLWIRPQELPDTIIQQ